MTPQTDKLGRVRRATSGAAGPKHLPTPDAPKAGAFDTFPPADLEDAGLDCWHWAVDALTAMGVLDAADRYVVHLCASAWQDYTDARTDLARYGRLILMDGDLKRNPATLNLKDARAFFHSCLSSLGLTPSARARLGATGSTGPDEFEQLLARASQKKN